MVDRNELPNDVNFVIFGVPWEVTSTSPRAGAKEGPSAIRKAFEYFSLLTEMGTDIFRKKIVDIGNVSVYPTLIEETIAGIEDIISLILAANPSYPAIPIALGGDHFITYPIVRSLIKTGTPKFGLIIFDAHVDLYDMWLYKEKYAHSTVFHRILELPSIKNTDIIFIGTRDIDYEEAEFLKMNSISYISAYNLPQQNSEAFILECLELFHKHDIKSLYISIDIDVLDPSIAPGTGYPTPGGLSYRQLWHWLSIIAREFKVLGFDVVELCPKYDPSEITAITAARIVTEFLGFISETMD